MTVPADGYFIGDMRQTPDGEWSPVSSKPVLSLVGLKVLAEKSSHGIYESLREAGRDIQHNVLIIGLDSERGAKDAVETIARRFKTSADELLKTPFFLYLEDYITLVGTENSVPRDIASLLKHPNFLGVISHIKDTCVKVFTSLGIRCYHLPTSSTEKDATRISNRIASLSSDRPITLVHWGSYKDFTDDNAHNRGMGIVNQLVGGLLQKKVNVRLLMKNATLQRNMSKSGYGAPALNPRAFAPFKDENSLEQHAERVELVTEYLAGEELQELFYTGDIFLLPSRQVHSASLTNAFSYGMPVIGSTGWGMSEYCFNSFNSLTGDVAEGHFPYHEIERIDGMYVERMLPRLTALCGDRGLLAKMSENTLAWYNSNHSRENHKANLHGLVDLAMSRHVR